MYIRVVCQARLPSLIHRHGRRGDPAKVKQHPVPQADPCLMLGFPGPQNGISEADHGVSFRINVIILQGKTKKICAKLFTKFHLACIIIYIQKNTVGG
jgi:hypothetical protein